MVGRFLTAGLTAVGSAAYTAPEPVSIRADISAMVQRGLRELSEYLAAR